MQLRANNLRQIAVMKQSIKSHILELSNQAWKTFYDISARSSYERNLIFFRKFLICYSIKVQINNYKTALSLEVTRITKKKK